MKTRILRVQNGQSLGQSNGSRAGTQLESWSIPTDSEQDLAPIREAAQYLRSSDVPVAFPTETVYGLGADATRSGAVKGIYATKRRPADNPLIVHVCDLQMLRRLLVPADANGAGGENAVNGSSQDPIPSIYKPVIERFWPGPLTILMPNPQPSHLAPEVTAGLKTFGARMPATPLARTLIKLVDAPLAAPSANASTKPSPTAAWHVNEDLDGRIELILDGGSCPVGVESTVVDGLCDPPVVLRPGGVSLEELRSCPGWEHVENAYKDHSETGKAAPRAPGMKYKHYSPKAKVVLYEAPPKAGSIEVLQGYTQDGGVGNKTRVGFIRTRRWAAPVEADKAEATGASNTVTESNQQRHDGEEDLSYEILESQADGHTILDIGLGQESKMIAQGLFSAMRELDRRGADIIFVEGIEDRDDIAAAVMNRLRKAASETRA
ncbi:putative translation initiation protein sua5 protein [Phaeoacremonium minimum UCRPA7]|uniref:Threonylcarbamoyl-AMP synthase n=1 Tax=Phaeoacremonium minimum (strain UCR-PA7) TaxID=1286976 RepID=R8BVD1_PHAM7|nr:putative translation initiation protein sua5 protein [Phaeoacremonium minimum UCRPA7]EOO03254.1 putative translation initiation protein sua5 protein [Phaeoacremonium minimum UCRPA7]